MFQSEFCEYLLNYLIKLTKPLTSENKPTFAWSNFKQCCFTFDNLGKKFPFWENFSNFEKAWWNCYKKCLLANKAEAKRREKRPSKTAPGEVQGHLSLFQYCKRPLETMRPVDFSPLVGSWPERSWCLAGFLPHQNSRYVFYSILLWLTQCIA